MSRSLRILGPAVVWVSFPVNTATYKNALETRCPLPALSSFVDVEC